MRKVPRCMSTQHPDNVAHPFFADSEVLAGESEVQEAFFVFSQLGCTEQMWDSEGKAVDNQVVEKLLSKYPRFFSKNPLGSAFYLTYRVPNPSVEKDQGKILLETLASIPRAFDVARAAGFKTAPIFEVILPMTTSELELERVKNYYEQIIIGQKEKFLGKEHITVKKWVGDFQPEQINIIPLFEDIKSLTNCGSIVSKFVEGKDLEYQRVFLARSDPALNYGSVSAVLLSKIALQSLHRSEEKHGIPILPILGVGGSPMRGNFAPNKVNNCMEEYPSVQTFTIQSSFKYDYPFREAANAIDSLNSTKRCAPLHIDEKRALRLVGKMKKEYQGQITVMADIINSISAFVPNRRARKLHVGLFGYSRSLGAIRLPRAIKFCASFYTIGIPPELLGISGLSEKEFEELTGHYVKLHEDLSDAARFLDRNNLRRMPKPVKQGISKVLEWIDAEPDMGYADITSMNYDSLRKGLHGQLIEGIKQAAWKRNFLG
ncbi:phosphoenolpyruvate carboxylase [Candidatus Micrarchaeota archaeon]|nr:phosphoenolpyruvate carboxylase [Candidatus Micrarchaeota archaeon]